MAWIRNMAPHQIPARSVARGRIAENDRMSTNRPDDGADTRRWATWAQQRPPARGPFFDNAAAGRSSTAVLDATAGHARLEASVGAYIAEEQAAPVVSAGRSALAGLLGVEADGVAFTESASAARRALLAAWPLADGDAIAVVASEWGPNLEAFRDRGLQVIELAAHGDGQVDLEYLESFLKSSPPAAVHLMHVASHRGLVQPVAEAARICRAAGVPLWVDAAQALGHVDTATGADAVYATSRKWLAGPRGVGLLGITRPWWDKLTTRVPAMAAPDAPPVRLLESQEAHVAGRVGLSLAVSEHLALDPAAVWPRLREVGRLTRLALADLPGWQVVDAVDAPGAITGLKPTAGQDLAATRRRLIDDHGIATTVAGLARAPREMREPVLRISPQVDCSAEDLAQLRAALSVR
jgi:pyridoxal 5-phosphate dependent beta-lyase